MFLQILLLGTTYIIDRGRRRICWNASTAWLDVSAKLPAGWLGSAAPLAVRSGLPGSVLLPSGLLGSNNLHVGSVRLPLCLQRFHKPTSWLDPTSRLARLNGCVAV